MAIPVTPVVRARDLRANIKTLGFEQGVTVTMEMLLEEFSEHRLRQREMTALISQLVDGFGNVTNVANVIKERVEELQRIAKQSEK